MPSASVPDAVVELIDRFDRNLDAYRSGHYNETQVRLEFIDPLFEALGWDVYNKKGGAEAYKDVIHELRRGLGAAKTGHDKTAIQRQIEATDREIDQLVYELYDLTDEEIKIVEEGTQ